MPTENITPGDGESMLAGDFEWRAEFNMMIPEMSGRMLINHADR
jgi:hypothetical protein